MKTEAELAMWLVENVKSNPLHATKVYWWLGDWTFETEKTIDIGTIRISFDLDVCHTYKGFDEYCIEFQPNGNKNFGMRHLSKFPSIIEKTLEPFKEFLKNIP